MSHYHRHTCWMSWIHRQILLIFRLFFFFHDEEFCFLLLCDILFMLLAQQSWILFLCLCCLSLLQLSLHWLGDGLINREKFCVIMLLLILGKQKKSEKSINFPELMLFMLLLSCLIRTKTLPVLFVESTNRFLLWVSRMPAYHAYPLYAFNTVPLKT